MAGYGSEFVNFFVDVLGEDGNAARPIGGILVGELGGQVARTIYFPPRNQIRPQGRRQPAGYVISPPPSGQSSTLPLHRFPDGVVRHVLVIPEHVTLWFAPGAFLQLEGNVAVIVRGGIRAGRRMIFSLPEVRRLREDIATVASDIRTVQSVVRLETTLIEEVHPEWFGVQGLGPGLGPAAVDAPANSRALQACIHAACRDRTRDGVSLPPLTVVCEGVYCIHETMRAMPTINGHGALWLRGTGDTSTRSSGIPSLQRFPIGEKTYNHVGTRDTVRQVDEAEDSALLWVHPRVSLDVDGVGLQCLTHRDGSQRTRLDVEHCVRVAGDDDGVGPLASRVISFDRCGLTGGNRAILSIDDRVHAAPLSPSGFAEAQLQTWDALAQLVATGGSVGAAGVNDLQFPPWEAGGPPPPNRYLRRHGARVRLNGCTLDGVINPLQEGHPGPTPARSSRRMIDAVFSDSSMLSITGGKIHQSPGPALGAQRRDADGNWGIIDLEAGIHLTGGLTLVRSVTFHLAEGPRPSRPPTEADLPDGQDIWIDTGPMGQTSTHLTVILVDSQSWWFLGARRLTGVEPIGAVSLLNVGANDVNLVEIVRETEDPQFPPHSLNGAFRDGGEGFRRTDRTMDITRLFHPPAVYWPGGAVPLLLEGCFFDRYCTTPDNAVGMIVNVGSVFRLPLHVTAVNWFPPTVIPRRLSRSEPLHLASSPVLEGRLIPEPLRVPSATLLAHYPLELVGRSMLSGSR